MDHGSGGQFGSDLGEQPFVGAVEIIAIGDECVTGVFHGFGSGRIDPLGGPELEGSFVAPRC